MPGGSTVTASSWQSANVITRSSVLPQRCVAPQTCCTISNDDSTSLRRRLSGSVASWYRTLKSPPTITGHALMTSVSKTAVNSSKKCAEGFSATTWSRTDVSRTQTASNVLVVGSETREHLCDLLKMKATPPPVWPGGRATSVTAYPSGVARRRQTSSLSMCQVSVSASTSSNRWRTSSSTASVLLRSDWALSQPIESPRSADRPLSRTSKCAPCCAPCWDENTVT